MRLRWIYVDIPETAPDALLCDLIAAVTTTWADHQGIFLDGGVLAVFAMLVATLGPMAAVLLLLHGGVEVETKTWRGDDE